jgi:hypothetical protein
MFLCVEGNEGEVSSNYGCIFRVIMVFSFGAHRGAQQLVGGAIAERRGVQRETHGSTECAMQVFGGR